MGMKENKARDAKAKANVQRMRDERIKRERAEYHTSEQAEIIRKIQEKNGGAKIQGVDSGTCMIAHTSLTMLTLSVVVLKAMTRQRSIVPMACDDGGDGKWTVLEKGHPNKKELGCGV
jgi:hypothetical protein